jgi:hypothetical protein
MAALLLTKVSRSAHGVLAFISRAKEIVVNKTLIGTCIAAMMMVGAARATAAPMFPGVLSGNTTPAADAVFTGAPDDLYLGLGGTGVVTYDFGPSLRVVNRSGAVDINVYEVDFGAVEFALMGISVSMDGVAFTSIKASEASLVRIAGDSVHGNNSFGRSYDLGAFSAVRYVRITGLGGGASGGNAGFDLDAIGAHEVRRVQQQVPEPASSALVLAGLAFIARRARRR